MNKAHELKMQLECKYLFLKPEKTENIKIIFF